MKKLILSAACAAAFCAGAAQAQTPSLDPQLLPLAEKETPAVLETLRALTSVDSGTGQEPGLMALADQIEQFAKGLGGEVERITPAAGVAGKILVITFKGTGRKSIMLMAHQDTVYVAGTAAARPFRVEGNRAIAPGIADDKGGIAVWLHAMKLLKARGFTDYERVTMVFNTDEERGSAGSRDTIRAQAGRHDFVMSGEPTAPTEGLVLATSGGGGIRVDVKSGAHAIEELADTVLRTRELFQQVPETRMNWTVMRAADPDVLDAKPVTITWRIKGKGSHAGVAPELGINAVVEAAMLVRRASDAAAQMPGVRIHWREMSGGLVSNIIPDQGTVVLEVAGADARSAADALVRVGSQAGVQGAQVSAEVSDTPAPSGVRETYATADVRVPTQEAFSTLAGLVRQRAEAKHFADSVIATGDGLPFPPFNANAQARELAAQAVAIDAQMGGKLLVSPRIYGATDAAWAGQSGKPVIESLGLPGGNYHSSQEEFILVDRIPRRLALAAELIRAASHQP